MLKFNSLWRQKLATFRFDLKKSFVSKFTLKPNNLKSRFHPPIKTFAMIGMIYIAPMTLTSQPKQYDFQYEFNHGVNSCKESDLILSGDYTDKSMEKKYKSVKCFQRENKLLNGHTMITSYNNEKCEFKDGIEYEFDGSNYLVRTTAWSSSPIMLCSSKGYVPSYITRDNETKLYNQGKLFAHIIPEGNYDDGYYDSIYIFSGETGRCIGAINRYDCKNLRSGEWEKVVEHRLKSHVCFESFVKPISSFYKYRFI